MGIFLLQLMEIFTHLYKFLHPLIWVFFCSKCVKFVLFYFILKDYRWADVVVLISFPIQTLSQSQSLSNMVGGVENLANTRSGQTYVTSPIILGTVEHVESESRVKKERENKKKKRCLHYRQVCQNAKYLAFDTLNTKKPLSLGVVNAKIFSMSEQYNLKYECTIQSQI